MPRKTDGSGTIYLRGDIWWVKIRVDGRPVYESSKSTKKTDAIKLRDKMLGKKSRGELSGGSADRVLITELLDDVLKSDIKPSTRYVWEKVIEKNIRPFFGKLKAQRLTTDHMDKYREKRKGRGAAMPPPTASSRSCVPPFTTRASARRPRSWSYRISRSSPKPISARVF
jgi:hypothetical protein